MFQKIRSIMNSGSVMGYFLQVFPVAILVGILYVVIRIAFFKKQNRQCSKNIAGSGAEGEI